MTAYGKPYTVRGWGDEVVTTVAVVDETAPEGYRHVVRGTELAGPVILVPTAALTPVDTTPAEPEPGAWLISGVLCVRWFGDDCEDADYPWCSPLHSFTTFRAIWTRYGGPDVPIVRLVPEPAPVDLPWETNPPNCRVMVGLDEAQVFVETLSGGRAMLPILSPDTAEAMAAALLTAAHAARAGGA